MNRLLKSFKSFSLSGRSKAKAKPDYEASAEDNPGEAAEQLQARQAEKDCKEKAFVVVKNNEVRLVEPCSSTSSTSGDVQNDNVVAGTDVCDGPQEPERSIKKLATDGPAGPEDSSEDYYSDSESDDDDEPRQIPVVQMDSPTEGRFHYCFAIQVVEPAEAADEQDEDDGVVPAVTENSSSHSPVTEEAKQNFQLEPEAHNDEGVQQGGQYLVDGDLIDQHEISHSLAEYPQEDSGNLSAYLEENNMFDDDPIEGDVASLGDGSYEYSGSFYADNDYESS